MTKTNNRYLLIKNIAEKLQRNKAEQDLPDNFYM